MSIWGLRGWGGRREKNEGKSTPQRTTTDKGWEAGESILAVWVWLGPSGGYMNRKHGEMRKEMRVGM